jgi:outer membrane scaffolding protein for murein synthesis (MipA/OmpV family)
MMMQSKEAGALRGAAPGAMRPANAIKPHKLATPVAALLTVWGMFPQTALATDMDADAAVAAPVEQVDANHYGDFRDTLADWQLTVGAGAIYMPEYEGSGKFKINALPLLSAQYGERVHFDITGVTVDIFKHEGFRLGVKGGYETGRKEDDSEYLRGLGDIDAGGVIGGVISYGKGPFEVYANLNKTIGGSEGLTGALGAKASYRYERFIFSADMSGTWADDNHMQSYFGITSSQSQHSGLAEYDAKAGFKRIDVKASVTYMVTDNWLVTGAAGAGFLMGDAKDSPIVRDDVQPFALLGLSYRF